MHQWAREVVKYPLDRALSEGRNTGIWWSTKGKFHSEGVNWPLWTWVLVFTVSKGIKNKK